MGCHLLKRNHQIETEIPGEEILLDKGEPAPFDGVLLPPGIYKQALPHIDKAYDDLWSRSRNAPEVEQPTKEGPPR